MALSVRDRLGSALRQALRDRDRETVGALRLALAAIDNAEAIPVESVSRAGAIEMSTVGVGRTDMARRELTEEVMRTIVAAEETDLLEASAQYHDVDPTRARALAQAASVLRAILDE